MTVENDFVLDLTFNELAQGEAVLKKQLAEEREKSNPDFARIVLIGTALEAIRVTLKSASKQI